MLRIIGIAAVCLGLGLGACRTSDGGNDGAAKADAPKRVQNSKKSQKYSLTATKGLALSTKKTMTIDLAVKLSKHGSNEQEKSPLPCAGAFSGSTQIGDAKCIAGKGKTVAVLAENVTQICSNDPSFNVAATKELKVDAACTKVQIEIFEFDPAVSINY